MKRLTYEQVAARKEKAARFVDDVLDDPERADEIDDESVHSYAERRGFAIENENPRRSAMTKTEQLEEQIQDLEEENDLLRERLNQVIDVAAADEYDDDDEAEDGEPDEFEDAA